MSFGRLSATDDEQNPELPDDVQQRLRYDPFPQRDADLLHRLYVDEGLTQDEMADALGVSQSTVSRRLRGEGIIGDDG
ncbi:helix-turn-helix domain-containing protein [Haloplanus natans]|uniref:helix-turn-helix domain-containing protein n=1 Tax=Haloplanus natans TaxID=376171 RepID=UPI0006782811|nr:helix-turn-helix domain-containing protein [Haloplanus natans]